MICWYCHWGWARAVRDIYERARAAVDALGGADGEYALGYGPAHAVWADENWDCAAFCLAECDSPRFADWDPAVLQAVRQSLRELDALPEGVRDPCPADYDGFRPEAYPPPPGAEMECRRAVAGS